MVHEEGIGVGILKKIKPNCLFCKHYTKKRRRGHVIEECDFGYQNFLAVGSCHRFNPKEKRVTSSTIEWG